MQVAENSVVYAFKVGAFVKIGTTRDLRGRLATAQTFSPQKIEVLASGPGDGRLERALHRQFAYKRQEGEWFRLNQAEIVELKARIEGKKSRIVYLPPATKKVMEARPVSHNRGYWTKRYVKGKGHVSVWKKGERPKSKHLPRVRRRLLQDIAQAEELREANSALRELQRPLREQHR